MINSSCTSKINSIGLYGWIREQISNNFSVWIVAWKCLVKDLGFRVFGEEEDSVRAILPFLNFIILYICLKWFCYHLWALAQMVARFSCKRLVPSSIPGEDNAHFCSQFPFRPKSNGPLTRPDLLKHNGPSTRPDHLKGFPSVLYAYPHFS